MSQGFGSGQGQGAWQSRGAAGGSEPYAPAGGGFGAPGPSAPGWGPAPTRSADPQRTASVAKLGLAMLITGALVLVCRLANRIVATVGLILVGGAGPHDLDDHSGLAIGAAFGGLAVIVISALGLVFALANMVLSIIAAVQSTGRGRVAAIVSAALPLVGLIIGFILGLLVGVVGAVSAADGVMPLWVSYAGVALETLVTLIVGGGLVVCAIMVRRWARSLS